MSWYIFQRRGDAMSYVIILVVGRERYVDRTFSTKQEAQDYRLNLLNLPEEDRHFDSVEVAEIE